MMKKNLNNHKIDYYYYKNDISKQEEKNQKKQGWYEEREGGIDLIFDDGILGAVCWCLETVLFCCCCFGVISSVPICGWQISGGNTKEKSWLKTFSDEIETLLIYKNRRIPGKVAIFVKILNPGNDFDYNREKWFGSSFGDSEHVARK